MMFDNLLGKDFVHGETDCYSIWRAVYKQELDMELPNFARPNDWWINDLNLYMDNVQKHGFKIIEEEEPVKLFDVFMVAIPDPRKPDAAIANHAAIYIGDGNVIHHQYGKKSRIIQYTGMLKRYTVARVRHKDVDKPEIKEREELNLIDVLPPHKKYLKDVYDEATS